MRKSLKNNLWLKLFALLLAVIIYHSLKTNTSKTNNTSDNEENDRSFFRYIKWN